jgi:hypothetical protein
VSDDANRTVCFCFGHTAADILAGVRADGTNAIVESITDACRRGLGRCEQQNPSGKCCLGEVRAIAAMPARACCQPQS